jgi:hypothetical protein
MPRGLHITDTTHIAKTPIEALEEEVPCCQNTRWHVPKDSNLYIHGLEIQNSLIQNSYYFKLLKINFLSFYMNY